MSFDKPTRNRLQSLVANCRRSLQADIEDQLQSRYGMYRADERIQPIGELSALSFDDQDIAAQLRDLFGHYRAQEPDFTAAYDRLVHEIGFTSLNRLVALRLAEERGYVVECVRNALDSEGFRIYQLIVEDQLGAPFDTYRFFLHLIFDEMAVDLHFLFDRSLPQGLVFPSEPVLRKVLTDLSAADLMPLWKEDETIGWVYQFFNDPDERKRMREQSQAPRNSREMAVRNQFFTPRYVVEFLVDNTLGRTWIEMRQGKTGLKERCQYLLKRTDEVFLSPQVFGGGDQVESTIYEVLAEPFDLPAEGDDYSWKRSFDRAWALAHQVDGYRSPQWTDRENTPAHYDRLEPEAKPLCADDLTTQEILEAMYLRLRGDRMSDGPGSADPARNPRLYEAANEVRRRYQESIKPDATKEELLAAPFLVPFRSEKDPRDIKILDPACGSGHFLLYAFDLLEAIYREAWNEPSEPAPPALRTGQTLREDYESLEELEKALPGLILANNLFGVDIDPRAAQISAVALWLRAQRAYQEAGVRNLADRPQITKMNFVVAEPMPGEADLKREFLDGLRPRVVAQVAEKVFDVMKLAGEAGVLLRVEQALSETLSAARKQWEAEREVPEGLFPELAKARTKSLFDVSDIDDDAFWAVAEETILQALLKFAEAAEASSPLRRRLFADDSVRGFAFIDLCRTRFDAFLMNPPFGEPTSSTKPIMELDYQDAKSDVLQAFVERGGEMLTPGGMLGCISSRTPFFLGGSQDFRERVVLRQFRPSIFVDLGHGVMDAAMVEAATYALRTLTDAERRELVNQLAIDADAMANEKGGAFRRSHWEARRGLKRRQAEQELEWLDQAGFVARGHRQTKTASITEWKRTRKFVPPLLTPPDSSLPIPFARVIGAEDKSQELLQCLHGRQGLFFASLLSLRFVPGIPFSYWLEEPERAAFGSIPSLKQQGFEASIGASTKDDFRYLRAWWEVSSDRLAYERIQTLQGMAWATFAKGGGYRPFWQTPVLVVKWLNDGKELKEDISDYRGSRGWGYQWTAALNGHDKYFRYGLTWGSRASRLCFKVLPSGSIFSSKGPGIFDPSHDKNRLLVLLAVSCSSTLERLASATVATTELAQSYEVGQINSLPIAWPANDLALDISLRTRSVIAALMRIDTAQEVDRLFVCPASSQEFDDIKGDVALLNGKVSTLYGLEQDPRPEGADVPNGGSEEEESPGRRSPHEDQISYLVGLTWGRWDIQFAGSTPRAGGDSDPFDPLPVCPPGMLKNAEGLPATETPFGYPLEVPWDGLLVDDPGDGIGEEHSADLVLRIRRAMALTHGNQAGALESEFCESLQVASLRDYLRKPVHFFADHLKRYSKSRRKAPIFWPLSTTSGSYSIWIYYPRLSERTLYTAVEGYVRPKLAAIERQRNALEVRLRDNPLTPSKDRDLLGQLRTFALELADLRDELLRVAALPYIPDLDDGVVINAAPLRKLFRHKPWVKELDEVWKKLEKGDYDWSRMAFHLWPDRVRAKCAKDRSLAIAHDLESICTAADPTKKEEGARGRKKREQDKLIEEDMND